jgi:hypothetical protein
MASFYFGVNGPNIQIKKEFHVADADAPRILAYLMSGSYGTVTENVKSLVPDASWSPGEKETEADRPMIETQAWVTRAATPEEAITNYALARFNELRTAPVENEKAQAAAAAAAAITPIEVIG